MSQEDEDSYQLYEDEDEDSSEIEQSNSQKVNIPTYKCANKQCQFRFYLSKTDKIIRCPQCGYRILYKLRTLNQITYKTE